MKNIKKMFSGSDSAESQSYTQWALNPSTYNNVANDQVDWAALAQQWIIMKEAGPPPIIEQTPNAPPPPPPPNISKIKKDSSLNEGGEAPMDVENDKDDDDDVTTWNNDNIDTNSWNWQQQQQSQTSTTQPWGWNNPWPVPAGVPPPNNVKAPLLPTPPFNQFSTNENETIPFPNYTSTSSAEYAGGYWTASGSSSSSKIIKPHNKRYSKVNVPVPVVAKQQTAVVLDAAKRKQLPAWIREGLEKMEKEKQKQLDKEREKQVKQEYEERLKLSEKEAMDIIKSTVKEQQKGKFDSDDENSNDTDGRPVTPEAPTQLSQEDLMLKVRRTMTEILLKVTSKEIYNICTEELQRHLKKLKASDHRVSAPSGANISAQLGLGVYGGSGSSTEDETDGEDLSKDYRDSDMELKDTIRRRKAEFTKVEREIEERLAEADGVNKREIGGVGSSRASTPGSDNDSQVDAKNQVCKRRNLNDNTPPPKSVSHQNSNATKRAAKKNRKSSTSSYCSDDSDKDRKKKCRKSRRRSVSSTDSDGGVRRHKSRRYSRSDSSRGRTPELKKSKYGSSSKSSSCSQSRRSRSKSASNKRRRRRQRSRSESRKRSSSRRNNNNRRSTRKRSSRSRSRSRSYRSRRSRSISRHRSSYSRSNRSRSKSRNQRSSSRTSYGSRRSRRSRSRSNNNRRRRSRSYSSSRGKRSHRH